MSARTILGNTFKSGLKKQKRMRKNHKPFQTLNQGEMAYFIIKKELPI